MKPIILTILFSTIAVNCWANDTYSFNCHDSSISGHIKYSMVLNYDFSFKNCRGIISYNPLNKEINFVDGLVMLKSIQSNCPLCNRIVLSRRILHESLFPTIQYRANQFSKSDHLYKVKGQMRVHGVTRTLNSFFYLKPLDDHRLLIQGSWLIPRKDYDIIWSKYLDHGGVVVADTFTINWQVIAHKVTK